MCLASFEVGFDVRTDTPIGRLTGNNSLGVINRRDSDPRCLPSAEERKNGARSSQVDELRKIVASEDSSAKIYFVLESGQVAHGGLKCER